MIPGVPGHLQQLGSGRPRKVEWLYLIPSGAVRQVHLESFVDEAVETFSLCVCIFLGDIACRLEHRIYLCMLSCDCSKHVVAPYLE